MLVCNAIYNCVYMVVYGQGHSKAATTASLVLKAVFVIVPLRCGKPKKRLSLAMNVRRLKKKCNASIQQTNVN